MSYHDHYDEALDRRWRCATPHCLLNEVHPTPYPLPHPTSHVAKQARIAVLEARVAVLLDALERLRASVPPDPRWRDATAHALRVVEAIDAEEGT